MNSDSPQNNFCSYHGKKKVLAERFKAAKIATPFVLHRIEGYPRFDADYMGWAIFTRNPQDPERLAVENGVSTYNSIVDQLNATPGFLSYFEDHDLIVTKEQIAEDWSPELSESIFRLEEYLFQQEIHVSQNTLYADGCCSTYRVTLDEVTLEFRKEKSVIRHRVLSGLHKIDLVMWNRTDDELDFTFYLWQYFDARTLIQLTDEIDSGYSVYEQGRDCMNPDERMLRALTVLEQANYLKTYSVDLSAYPYWSTGIKSDGTVDIALLSPEWKKDLKIVNELKSFLEAEEDETQSD